MPRTLLRLLTTLASVVSSLAAQEARVRPATRVDMPTEVDSNSPAFWRDGRLFWFGSHGRPWISEGADQFGPWETREVSLESVNDWPHWLESIYPDDDGVLWGWYHCEPVGLFPESTLTAPKIGAVVSLDGGRTLRDLGLVLESGDPLDPTAENGYFAGGNGDFSAIIDRTKQYFYFFFDNYGGPAEAQGVCVARMAFADRSNPAGKVWKYHNGQWQEAGLGGRVTPIFPVTRRWQLRDPDAFWGPSIHWNTSLSCYVILLNRAMGIPGWSQEGVYVSFCSDLSRPDTWTPPRKILDKSEFSGWYFFYPQVMGLESGGTDRRAGATARLYVGGISKWEIDFIAPPRAPEAVQLTSTVTSPVLGQAVTLSVSATGTAPLSYQWFKDAVALPQATATSFNIPAATASDAGTYSVVVTNPLGTAESNPLSLAVTAPLPPVTPAAGAVLSNLAVRSWLTSDQAVLTLGFVLQRPEPKPLLLRVVGPSLALFGVAGPAADPRLEVFGGTGTMVAANDDWPADLAESFSAAGAFALPLGSADAGLQATLPAGAYTAQVRAATAGIVLAEAYDPTATTNSKLVNFAARGVVGTGEQVMILGFSLSGSGTKRLLIRALGPQLALHEVDDVLPNPVLEVRDATNQLLAANDGWDASLAPTFAAVGAPALVSDSRDAAVVVTLTAGARYSVTVRSAGEETGEALLEIYEVR